MTKSTLVLVTVAALGLGALVGYSLVDSDAVGPPDTPAGAPAAVATGGAPVLRYLNPANVPDDWPGDAKGAAFAAGENFFGNEKAWHEEVLTIELAADERVEYKLFMSQGDVVLFNWWVDGEEVYYDLHAHDDAFGEDFFTRYDEGYGTRRSGAFVAPYPGQHGWYWQNLEPEAETITLEIAGFYDRIAEIELP